MPNTHPTTPISTRPMALVFISFAFIATVADAGDTPAFPRHCRAAPAAPVSLPEKSEVRPFPTTGRGLGVPREAGTPPPLWENLGTLHYPVTTSDATAQRYFDQGLRLSYAFNHEEARRAFREAARLDPSCAMCYWGIALCLGPNINAPMEPEAHAAALAAIEKAEAQAPRATQRERALIAALRARYGHDHNPPAGERSRLDAAYADAMQKVATRYPEDGEIQVLYAEALMDLSPWDYWEAGGSRPKGRTAEAVAILERVLATRPDHPGAIHYYIHLVEASDRPERAAPHADRLGALMPGAGHLVHMPFHIYFRSGRYLDALRVNQAAVAADERYSEAAAPNGIYPMAYYPHNVHSLLASALMAGDGKTAITAADKLARVVTEEAARTVPWVQPIAAAPYFAHARFSTPDTILALPAPRGEFPFVEAMWHYARGLAFAARRERDAAARELEAIARLAKEADFSVLTAAGIPARQVLTLAHHLVEGRIAQAHGELPAARLAFQRAVAVQDGLGYTEPPHWYYPVRQSLGAVLLEMGDLDGAASAFRKSLRDAPHNGWALHGLAEVYRRQGKTEDEAELRARLAASWSGAAPDLERL